MNLDPPEMLEWIVLVCVGALVGMIRGLRTFATQEKATRIILGVIDALTAMFTTGAVFTSLYTLVPLLLTAASHYFPEIAGYKVPLIGYIGLSGLIAHMGIRSAILAVRGIADKQA